MTTDDIKTDPITLAASRSPQVLAGVLLAVAVACLIPVFLYGGTAFFPHAPQRAADASSGETPPPPTLDPHRSEHIAYALAGIIGAALAVSLAGWVFTRCQPTQAGGNLTRIRTALLASGALLGGIIMLFGLTLFVIWFESVSIWLNAGDTREAHKVVIPIAVFLVGAAPMFFGVQPARAEERNNPFIRRFIYGTNLGLMTLLLLFVLLAGNILLALKLPNKLDTTETGFYSLTSDTKNYLSSLDQRIIVYTNITPDRRVANDVHRLLEACHDANPTQFQMKVLSPVSDRDELKRLQAKYPQFDLNDEWVIVAAGDDESRSSLIPMMDMVSREGNATVFNGEGKLMREVLFLADSKTKPIVYFTQGHGELAFGQESARLGPQGRTANALKSLLEKNYVDVRVWTPDAIDPKVPDDATAVIIADPRLSFRPEEAIALERYMTASLPGSRKGKLILLTSPFPNTDGKGVADTGLEGLLQSFSVTLGKGYLLSVPVARGMSYNQQIVAPSMPAIRSGNPIAALISADGAPLTDCRSIEVRRAMPGDENAMRAELLLGTYPSDNISWFDTNPPVNPEQQLKLLAADRDLRIKYKLTQATVPVAAVVSEGRTSRMLVIGSGMAFADGVPRSGNTPPPVNLIAAGVDWLRDRPSLAAVNKAYKNYTLPKTADGFRLFWLPVGLAMLIVVLAGLGVWVVRRM